MPYVGARLAPLFRPEPSRRAARRMTARGAEAWRRNVVQNTPIDDAPYPSRAPGTARRSWRTKPVVGPIQTLSAETYHSGVETEDDVASFLETGTGLYGPHHKAYIIRPKNPEGYLHFFDRKTGHWVFAKQVLHPGIHAQRPLATGAVITEHELGTILQPTLVQWIREVELLARAEQGLHRGGF